MSIDAKEVGAFKDIGEVATVIEDNGGWGGAALTDGTDKPSQISKRTGPGEESLNICAASSFVHPNSESSLT